MRKLIIAENFHVDVGQGQEADGTDKPSVRKPYSKGMVVDPADLPDGHTADAWIEKGLATWAEPDVETT